MDVLLKNLIVHLLILAAHLVRANVDDGHFLLGNQGTQLLDQGHQGFGGFFIAHLHVERLAEHLAVPRHIHLRNQQDIAQAAVLHQLLKLLLRVKLARHARIIFGGVQLRINFGFQPPAGVLRKMEVVNIQLELRHGIQLPCNQRQRHVIASHIVHESADSGQSTISQAAMVVVPPRRKRSCSSVFMP